MGIRVQPDRGFPPAGSPALRRRLRHMERFSRGTALHCVCCCRRPWRSPSRSEQDRIYPCRGGCHRGAGHVPPLLCRWKYSPPAVPRQFQDRFSRLATRRWRELVGQDTDRQILPSPRTSQAHGPTEQIFTRYGTTLLAALVVGDTILLAQIGDGDLLLVRPGGTIEFPLPRDPVLAGNETHSLSSADAHLLWRTATIDRGEGGILLGATDGISDSFAGSESEEFSVFVHSLADRIRTYGTEAVAAAIGGWLDRFSEIASGDDMTLVWACIRPEERLTQEPEPDNDASLSGKEGW